MIDFNDIYKLPELRYPYFLLWISEIKFRKIFHNLGYKTNFMDILN